MTLLFLIETFVEIFLLIIGMYFLYMARKFTGTLLLSHKLLLAKRFIGFGIAIILAVCVLNYSYVVYRYAEPARISDYVTNPYIGKCQK